jgi:predicted DNA-binding mobile mystery protein A
MIKDRQAKLARKNLDRKLAFLREESLARPRGGWIRAIRDALGMSSRQLAKRMGVVQSRIVALEKAEATDSTSLKSLREAAEALNCKLVYALIPHAPLDEIVRNRAAAKAIDQFAHVAQSRMRESQSLTVTQMNEEIERLTVEILHEPLRYLWEDE